MNANTITYSELLSKCVSKDVWGKKATVTVQVLDTIKLKLEENISNDIEKKFFKAVIDAEKASNVNVHVTYTPLALLLGTGYMGLCQIDGVSFKFAIAIIGISLMATVVLSQWYNARTSRLHKKLKMIEEVLQNISFQTTPPSN